MFGNSLRDPWQPGGYRNRLVEKGHISHPFPTIRSFQNYWKILLKTVNKVFLLRLLHYSYHFPQRHELWNHIPLQQTLTLDSRTWRVLSHHYNFHLKTLRQLSDTVTRTIQMKPVVQEYQQRKHFCSHRRSPSPSTISHLLISKSYIKGPNLIEMDVPWVAHQHHTMPTSVSRSGPVRFFSLFWTRPGPDQSSEISFLGKNWTGLRKTSLHRSGLRYLSTLNRLRQRPV